MNKPFTILKAFFLQSALLLYAVETSGQFTDFLNFYPIGESPNICFKSSYVKSETILFEGNPIVRYSFYNNFVGGLVDEKKHTEAWYVSFRPQIRMYTDNSLPVKTPSYRILLGTQHLFRLQPAKPVGMTVRFAGFSLESGHYSNGQSGCAFSEQFDDGSAQCEMVYNTITPDTDLSAMLNRKSGNFSTNLTELILNYRVEQLDSIDYKPYITTSFKAGVLLYHDKFLGVGSFGGYSDEDIKIYGRHRFLLGFEYARVLKKGAGRRFSIADDIELIQGAHKHVNPFRNELTFSFYPFLKVKAFGFFAGYIYGHDNYNFRFVDARHQVAIGIKWDQFPPITMKK